MSPNVTCANRFLRPENDRAQVAEGLGRREDLARLERRARRRGPDLLRPRDAAVPVWRAPHRPPEGLLGRRRDRALPPPHRPQGPPPDGLRRLRPAGREPRDQDRPAPARVHRGGDQGVPAPVPRVGDLDRLGPRVRHTRALVLPLDPVDLPAPVREGPRVSQGRRGQLVPEGRDRAGERAGDRRPLRALRHAGRGAPARAVVLQHHRLRRPPARRPPHDRVAGPRRDDAGELDRPLRGRRGRLPLRGARHRLPGVHHAPGHALRRDVLRHGARAPGHPEAERLARGARLHRARGERVAGGARRRGQGEDRGLARAHRHEPRQRRADPDVRRGLRADGVRHRGDHGRPRATTSATTPSPRSSASRSGGSSSAATCRAPRTAR